MEFLIVILNKEDYFEELISLLVEAGVNGATILDSQGLGYFLAYEVPIFAGLRQFMGESKSVNKTILAVLDNEDVFPKFKKLLAEEKIDFTEPGTGLIIRIPASEVIKSTEELD